MASEAGLLIVISAASGTGKTTLVQKLLCDPCAPQFSISHTTRPPRAGEVEGRDYRFVSEDQFSRMIQHSQFVEWALVHGHHYGTAKRELETTSDLLLDVDTQGALRLKALYPDRAVLIFLAPPSLTALRRRLQSRGTESEEVRQRRLEAAAQELACQDRYDYVIINDDIQNALGRLVGIIEAERAKRRDQGR